MSSTTPGQGPRDAGGGVSPEETPARPDGQRTGETPADRTGPADGGRPAGSSKAGGPTAASPTGADRAAMRTSLAERFASAKAAPAETAASRTSTSGPASTARMGATDGPAPAPREQARSAPAATAAGAAAAGGAARAERTEPRPAPAQPTQPGAARPDGAGRPAGPRQVRLSLARIDPWSVMKLAFLLSIAVGIGIVVATAAMWYVLDTMHVFADIQGLLDSLGSESFLNLMEYAQFDRVISMAAIVAVVDVLLLTALATLGAFLYNIVAALVGGLHLTLTDD
ncbi:DUF3566 domain-containing protein [Georgenia wangjunii]|uniref:DUF3566 domain-containing protein n=1 Tax=Georgenia wangjunii TaxID=3117730 RepID=UPI002F264550